LQTGAAATERLLCDQELTGRSQSAYCRADLVVIRSTSQHDNIAASDGWLLPLGRFDGSTYQASPTQPLGALQEIHALIYIDISMRVEQQGIELVDSEACQRTLQGVLKVLVTETLPDAAESPDRMSPDLCAD
jgi:hypothetical protein